MLKVSATYMTYRIKLTMIIICFRPTFLLNTRMKKIDMVMCLEVGVFCVAKHIQCVSAPFQLQINITFKLLP